MEHTEFVLFEKSIQQNLSSKYTFTSQNNVLTIYKDKTSVFSFSLTGHRFKVLFKNSRNQENPTIQDFNLWWIIKMELLPTQIIMIDNWMAIRLLE